MNKSVYIIILNWNGWKDTIDCLESLTRLEYDNRRILVVDNASTNDSVERISEAFPEVEIIRSQSNLGFSGGNNLAIVKALQDGADYIWLLNNDTVADVKALQALVSKADLDPTIGAVGSVLYYMDEPDKVQAWGGGWVSLWFYFTKHYKEPVPQEKINYLTAASILIRGATLNSIGIMDDKFFLYWEDTDLSFRIRKAGWKLDVAPDSKVWHKESASAGKSKTPLLDKYFTMSIVRFFRKHAYMPFVPIAISFNMRMLKRIITGKWQNAIAILRAHLIDVK